MDLETDIRVKMAKLKEVMAKAETGKALKYTLSKELRGIMDPLVQIQRQRVLGLPSKGQSPVSMRQAVARQTKASARWSGRSMGVSVIQRSRAMPRDFRMAGRMFNREEGWHPQSLGGEIRTQQVRPAQWFDGATGPAKRLAVERVHAALVEAADMIAASAR